MSFASDFALALLLGAALTGPAAAGDPPLALERTIALPDVSGRIDHMTVDLSRHRLFVAELGNDSVDVIDLAAGRVEARLDGLDEPQGIVFAAGADRLVVADGGDGVVHLYRGADLAAAGTVALADDADNVHADPATGHVLVGYGGGALAILDPAAPSQLADIALGGHPEGFQVEPAGARAFVNVPDGHAVAVVDLAAGRLLASWPTPDLSGNFPMAAAPGRPLAVVFRGQSALALIDPATGRIEQRLATCEDVDDVYYDTRRDLLYLSCGEGAVDVVALDGGRAHSVARIPTRPGARTALWVPELDRLFVAARAGLLGPDAAILEFRPAE